MKTTPKLKQIDLSKGTENKHPDIKADGKTPYLIKYGNEFSAGTFEKEDGLMNFDGWYGLPLQYDKPGTNRSYWQGVWEIVE